MLLTVEGIYRDGRIDLLEPPPDVAQSRVIVTFFVPGGPVDLRSRGIDEAQALDLRARLQMGAEDWERPEMSVYDAD